MASGSKKTPSSSKENKLMEFMSGYSSFLTSHQKDVDMGKSLLALGSKTETTQKLEKLCFNPMQAFWEMKKQADSSLVKGVDEFMTFFFKKAKEGNLVKTAYKKQVGTGLNYFIVLEDDTFKNRKELFKFLSFFSDFDFAEAVPVTFQVIPPALSSKMEKEKDFTSV